MSNKIILNLAVSLDGYIADERGGYDWIQPAGDRRLNTQVVWSHDKFLEEVSAVVMGRRCYDQGLHQEYGHKAVYVATSERQPDYSNIYFIGEDICREIVELRQKTAGDIYLFGGGLLIDPVLKAGLIDEYIIGIIPIILGKGLPLFRSGSPVIPLRLTHYYVEDGIVVLRYTPRDKKRGGPAE